MAILLIAEHDNTNLSVQTACALTAALQIGNDVDILVAGSAAGKAALMATGLHGIRKVLHVEGAELAEQLAEPLAALVVSIASGYDTIAAPATSSGKNVAPRIAALLDVAQVSDVIEVVAHDTFKRPIYAGNAIQTVKTRDAKQVLTIRASSFPAAQHGASCPVESIPAAPNPALSLFVGNELSQSDRPELSSAKAIVSGGRALGSAENFQKLILPLADKLNAAVGASRAAVDAGYAPNDWQVGQTGKIVAPELYVAVGISGAIQHVAGMKDSKTVIAINSDADAPIFQIADFGLVGDLFEIIPEMLDALN